MKTLTIEELDEQTGRWLREVGQHDQVIVTDQGHPLVSILSARPAGGKAGFGNRVLLAEYRNQMGRLGGGTDSTVIIAEDRDRRSE